MSISEAEPLLRVDGLEAGYGRATILRGVSLYIAAGEFVVLLGPNGAGKSTLLGAMSGLVNRRAGRIMLSGRDLSRAGSKAMASAGLAHVLEGHRVFKQLTILDNLHLACFGLTRREREARAEEALSLFPELEAKRKELGVSLSGGQQQMLAVAQGLARRPRLLLLDEPSAGLSPVLIDRILTVCRAPCQKGSAVLLVEQAVEKAIGASDRVYGMAGGRIVLEAASDAAELRKDLEAAYLGSAEAPDGKVLGVP